MRKRKSFLLTVIPSDTPQDGFCGQMKSIDTGKAFTFSSIEEFKHLLMIELTGGHTKPLAQISTSGKLPDMSAG